MKDVWHLWRTFLHKIVERRVTKYHKLPRFHQNNYSVFSRRICRKEKFVPDGSLTAWLLSRNRNTWNLQHYLLKQRFNVEVQTFLYRIFSIDETWVRDFEPELKSLSNEWRSPSSSRPIKFRRAQSKVKQMMILANYHRGTIMTYRVPCERSVTAAYYRDWVQNMRRNMHKNPPNFFVDVPLILHDNARPHLGKVVTDLLSK
jgi:hypothetical protein